MWKQLLRSTMMQHMLPDRNRGGWPQPVRSGGRGSGDGVGWQNLRRLLICRRPKHLESKFLDFSRTTDNFRPLFLFGSDVAPLDRTMQIVQSGTIRLPGLFSIRHSQSFLASGTCSTESAVGVVGSCEQLFF